MINRFLFQLNIRRLDLYIFKSFFVTLLLSIFALSGLYVVIHFFTNITDFIEISQQNLMAFIIWYYLIRIPLILSKLMPIIALIALMMTMLRLAKTRELIAMLASGLSIWRIILPISATLILVAAATFFTDNMLIPELGKHISLTEKILKSEGSDRFLIRQSRQNGEDRNQASNYEFIIKIYNYTSQQMNGVWINQFDKENNLIAQIIAKQGAWTEKGWMLSDGVIYTYDAKGFRASAPKYFKENEYLVACDLTPQSIEKIEESSAYMTLTKLNALVSEQPDNHNLKIQLYSKQFAPAAILILILLGLPFSIKLSKSQNFFNSIGICLVISLGFFIIRFSAENLGAKGIIPPIWAVLAPLLIFGFIGTILASKIRT